MSWSLSETIALITLLVGIPTSFVGVWTLVLCLRARRISYRKVSPETTPSTEHLEIGPLRGNMPPSPHARIPRAPPNHQEPHHDIESQFQCPAVFPPNNRTHLVYTAPVHSHAPAPVNTLPFGAMSTSAPRAAGSATTTTEYRYGYVIHSETVRVH
ncbi:hypothetical protein BDW74DRAFT_129245 [Aspergillus multicolor]|uniref:uncharacterized protein n=1 Tax=Aspergillus multicolor TaxID=41759 RepID=UPI003CCD9275